jgi:uncharacterized protein YbjT (DUF2867 family)
MLKSNDGVELTLFLRQPRNLRGRAPKESTVVQGDVLNKEQLNHAMAGQDVVYANLTGDDIDLQAKAIVDAMNTAEVKRLVFVASLEIYDEVPGKFGAWNRRQICTYLPAFRRAANIIEASVTNYTNLRPACSRTRTRWIMRRRQRTNHSKEQKSHARVLPR